ncbi:MAG: DUF6089 family protein [Cryomorphaceae bacterium]|nr:DUF6089 family protein [Flavobacteriales bacterium]
MNRLLFTGFLLLTVGQAAAQYHEVGAMAAQAHYIGELNSFGHIPDRFQLGGGLIYRYNMSDRFAFKSSILYGVFHADDADSDSEWQRNRNLSVRTGIFEVSGQIEMNFLTYEIGDSRRPTSPYLFLGFSIFRFNPQAQFNDRWVDLQPLGTEGQGIGGFGDRYPLTQVSVPFGIGFKFNIWRNFGGAVEWGMRRTWTDHLDDVGGTYVDAVLLEDQNGPLAAILADRSLAPTGPEGTNTGMQRGETNRTDYYIFAGFMITYKIGRPQIKCPTAL